MDEHREEREELARVQAQLAKVPALVEALRDSLEWFLSFGYEVGNDPLPTKISEALAAFEQEQA